METNKAKAALTAAYNLKHKGMAKGGEMEDPEGSGHGDRKCYACGGVIGENMAEGGIVEEAEPMDTDADLVSSSDPSEDSVDKSSNFLKAYLIHRKLQG